MVMKKKNVMVIVIMEAHEGHSHHHDDDGCMTSEGRSFSVLAMLPLLRLHCHRYSEEHLVSVSFEAQTPGFLRNINDSQRSLEDLAKRRLCDQGQRSATKLMLVTLSMIAAVATSVLLKYLFVFCENHETYHAYEIVQGWSRM